MKYKFLISLCMVILFSANLYASHLMGGSIGYEYIGLQINGKYRYKIKLTTYIDCSATSDIPYAEYPLKVGVYTNDIMNPNADKMVVDSLLLSVDDTIVYTPYLPPGCIVDANTCIIQARYSGFIELDASMNGYYLFYERCCRNEAILNLQPEGSDGFLSYIPPTSIVNSTPVFLYPPIPFLCANDTGIILNIATDIDGDSLVYEFTTPYNGFGSVSNPLPNLPAPLLSWPVPSVNHVPGFSYTNPFNFFGTATINNQNGVSIYFSLQPGAYVVCIIVKEYRNGVLISQTFRDLQLLINICPNNYSPALVDNLQRNYTTTQGNILCFPISFQDPENDSVFVDASGDIFDLLIVDSPAVFFITETDSNKATGNFCWNIPCTIDTGTYNFFIHSYDNGCLPKERYEFYTIRITPPVEPNLFGADTTCKGSDSVLYWITVNDNFQYNWNITNGAIIQNYGDSIFVNWGISNNGEVVVDVFTAMGCYLSSDSLDITLSPIPIASFSYDTVKFDCGGRWIQFTNTSSGATEYHWLFGNGNQSTDINPQALFPFGNTYIVELIATNAYSCSASYMDTITTDTLQNLVVFNHVNVFTPNDDGENDMLDFGLQDEFLECSKVYVYDRWGLLIFESSTNDLSWNGKIGGKKVPEGIYYWIIEVDGLPFKGFVHVFD